MDYNNDSYNCHEYLNFEFSQVPYENLLRQQDQYYFYPPAGNNIYSNLYPSIQNTPWNQGFTPPNIPQGPPPNYIPSKNDKGVQALKSEKSIGDIGTKSVSPNSISFCLYKYTYIWESNGRSYWTFLLNVDRTSVSGFRWLGRNWVYFGLDLRRIDSFICYRSDIFCEECNEVNNNVSSEHITKKEYSLTETRDVYTEILASINIPEVTEDYITEIIGYIDEKPVQSKIPCAKCKNTSYRLILEVSYPNTLNEEIKRKINESAKESCYESYNSVISSRVKKEYSNPLEIFNKTTSLIPEILKNFKTSFIIKVEKIGANKNNILFTIKEEIFCNNWNMFNKNK